LHQHSIHTNAADVEQTRSGQGKATLTRQTSKEQRHRDAS
jgi:hypothetical protein